MNKFTSILFYISYRKGKNKQNVLILLIREWRERLDNNYVVGSVFMDLLSNFDCIAHDLLIAKRDGYGFNRNSVRYIYSCLEKS